MLATPVIVALCRRKSTRLTAVIGGLVLALGILFTSFATQLHQVAFSYGEFLVCCGAFVQQLLAAQGAKAAVASTLRTHVHVERNGIERYLNGRVRNV